MRALLAALALGTAAAALMPGHEAKAWFDRFGRWHPNYYRPPVVYVPRPVPVYVGPPPARWAPPHYNRFGRFIPGHWY